jgi:hypothetical protein
LGIAWQRLIIIDETGARLVILLGFSSDAYALPH